MNATDPRTPRQLTARLKKLRRGRRRRQERSRASGIRRSSLTPREREEVLLKTSGRCHVCGGKIEGPWHADHVLAHASGGRHSIDNYLPAHSLCNGYRWDYSSEEFQLILKIGVWAADQVRKETQVGTEIARRFVAKELGRQARQTRADHSRPPQLGRGRAPSRKVKRT